MGIHAGAYFVLSWVGFCSSSKGNSNSFEKDSKCLKNKKGKRVKASLFSLLGILPGRPAPSRGLLPSLQPSAPAGRRLPLPFSFLGRQAGPGWPAQGAAPQLSLSLYDRQPGPADSFTDAPGPHVRSSSSLGRSRTRLCPDRIPSPPRFLITLACASRPKPLQ